MSNLDYQKTFNEVLTNIEEKDIKILGNDAKKLFTIANTIDVYKSDAISNRFGSLVACITIDTISFKPVIIVNSLFEKLSLKAKVFTIYHELGHYQNGDFFYPTKTTKVDYFKNLFKYPEKEILADYYAMDKMDSCQDALDSLEEIYSVLIDAIDNGVVKSKTPSKVKKNMMKMYKRRVRDLKKSYETGPYYISNETTKIYESYLMKELEGELNEEKSSN